MKQRRDEGSVPPGHSRPSSGHLHPHEVDTTAERGWAGLDNGELLDQAEAAGYEAVITTDQNLKHQQELSGRALRVIVLMTTAWPRIEKSVDRVQKALDELDEGGYAEVDI